MSINRELQLEKVGEYLPFHTLAQREACAVLLAAELTSLNLVDSNTGRIDPNKFQKFITQPAKGKKNDAAAEIDVE